MVDFGKDPGAIFQEFLAQWEKNVNAVSNKTMESTEFSRAIHQAMTLGVGTKAQLGELFARYLSVMNLPTRGDVIDVGTRLRAIRIRLPGCRQRSTCLLKLWGHRASQPTGLKVQFNQ